MAKAHVLIVDDEEDILQLIDYNLSKEGYSISCVGSGEEALRVARKEKPGLILLDLMLPGVDGLDVCRALKSEPGTSSIPIIMVSARGEESDIVTGLELGADDYVVKPFSPSVLRARVKSVLRRSGESGHQDKSIVEFKEFHIDSQRHEVLLAGQLLDLTASEFKTLKFLVQNPGRVYTRHQIVVAVHGSNYPVTDRSVDVQMVALRRKLGEFGDYIETVRGVGYRFRE